MSRILRFFRGLAATLAVVLAVSGAATVFVAVPAGEAWAQSGTVISRIAVRGNKRVESSTIVSYMRISPGERYDAFKIDESFKALFSTGLFSDVKINLEGRVLIVAVVENPVINRVAFEGNRKLTDEVLGQEVDLRARAVLTRTRVQNDVQRILTLYRRSGRFAARVEPKIIQLPQNRVDLVFEIDEGDKTGVSRINFIGNTAFSDGDLREVITTGESGFFSFFRSNDVYDPDRLAADQELLRRYYLRHGYADFRIVSAVADLDQDSNAFFITITVDEGPRYTFGRVQIESNVRALNPDELRSAVHTFEGEVYNLELIDRTLEDLTIEVSKLGYAFAQVRPQGDRDATNKTVSITYVIDEGARVYIERIEVRGNTRTQDSVIRREFDLVEGDPYNSVLIERAKRRLNALQFFKTVKINRERGSAPDRVVVVVDVEEQPTGRLSVGAGYSSLDGILGDISITERNLLGRGQFIRLAVSASQKRTDIDFSFTEPYFMERRVSAGIDLFSRKLDLTDESSYNIRKQGGGVRFGFPITPDLSVTTRYLLSRETITTTLTPCTGTIPPTPVPCTSAAIVAQQGAMTTSLVGYSLRYDTIDNKQNPSNGIYLAFSQDIAGVGGDVKFLRTTAEARVYYPVYDDYVAFVKIEGGHITGLGGSVVRVNDAFLKGGDTIRGFERAGIGPRDLASTNADALGGKTYVAATAELQFPIFGLPEDLGFKGAVFFDAGTVFGTDAGAFPGVVVADSSSLRSSVGFSILWNSPFGPLRGDFAWALTQEPWDKTELFRFGGGTTF